MILDMTNAKALLSVAERAARQADRLEVAMNRKSTRVIELKAAYIRAVSVELRTTAAWIRSEFEVLETK